jgi:hypothetical protein
MIILAGLVFFVGGLLTATVWSAISGTDRIRRRRGNKPYAL